MTAPPLPQTLRELSQRWNQVGRPPQRPIPWSRSGWSAALPEQAEFIASLPNPINRAAVRDLAQSAASSPDAATAAFVAAMVWGYGRVGYGPFRTARVLSATPDSGQVLMEVAQRADADGGPAAFAWLAQHRLRGLGVAFATKYLFFCTPPTGAAPALVLDRLVRDWLTRNAGWSLRLDWNVADYASYVGAVVTWATELDLDAADVELLMFTDMASLDPTSQWSESESFGSPTAPAAAGLGGVMTAEAAGVLDALNDAADAFAALPGATPAADADDFEHGLRLLRRIVLARSPS